MASASAPPPPPAEFPVSHVEGARLAELDRYRILDSCDASPEFDRLTSMAARLCETPIALVSIVASERQWFKSNFGLREAAAPGEEEPTAAAALPKVKGTPRSMAFCSYTIMPDAPDVLCITDATTDPRTKDNPLVTGHPHIRFYAGAPLISSSGLKLGTLCVIDNVPRPPLGPDERASLLDLAAMAMQQVEQHLATEAASRSAAEFGAMLQQASAPLFSVDQHGLVSQWNDRMGEITGWPERRMMGKLLARRELYPDEEARAAVRDAVAAALRGVSCASFTMTIVDGSSLSPLPNRRSVGGGGRGGGGGGSSSGGAPTTRTRERSLIPNATPQYDETGTVVGVVCVCQDATTRAQLVAQKNSFVASFSHELRTPLNGIMGMIDLASHVPALPSLVRRYLRCSTLSSKLLLNLINDILDLSKIEAGELDIATADFALREEITAAAELIRPQVQFAGISFSIEIDPNVPKRMHGPIARARQVLLNLLTNAIKFTLKGGTIKLRCRAVGSFSEQSRKRLHSLLSGNGSGSSGATIAAAEPWRPDPQPLKSVPEAMASISAAAMSHASSSGGAAAAAGDRSTSGSGSGSSSSNSSSSSSSNNTSSSADSSSSSSSSSGGGGGGGDGGGSGELPEDLSQSVLLEISVEDSGVGMTKEAQAKLFTIFAKNIGSAQAQTLNPRGTGLGLAISKKLVELMGGQVWVESTVGVGSKFTFTSQHTLRLCGKGEGEDSISSSAASCQSDPSLSSLKLSLHLLIAEDNEFNMEIIRSYVEAGGHTYHWAENGQEALTAYCKDPFAFDVVVMDCEMPVMDGYEATRRIRREEDRLGLSPCPILGLTANAFESDMANCLNAGMDDVKTKPVSQEKLLSRIAKVHRQSIMACGGARRREKALRDASSSDGGGGGGGGGSGGGGGGSGGGGGGRGGRGSGGDGSSCMAVAASASSGGGAGAAGGADLLHRDAPDSAQMNAVVRTVELGLLTSAKWATKSRKRSQVLTPTYSTRSLPAPAPRSEGPPSTPSPTGTKRFVQNERESPRPHDAGKDSDDDDS
jgi:signal transduction histidine kinase/CheY-like chemotaxis protein